MRRSTSLTTLVLVALTLVPSIAHAQEAFDLAVTDAVFTHADGDPDTHFSFGEPVHAYLELTNNGTEAATGISATLDFPRGDVSSQTASFPDAAPGSTVRNAEPFVFDYTAVLSGPADADCSLVLHDGQVDEDDVVIEPDEDLDVVVATEGEDPSEPVVEPPPGALVWTITSDQGSIEYAFGWAAVCAAAVVNGRAGESGGPDQLATTGSSTVALTAIAVGLIVLGARARRRPRGAHALR